MILRYLMKLLTKKELARKLCISYSYLDILRRAYQDFPKAMSFSSAQNGSRLFFDEAEIDSWLLANREKFRKNASITLS